MEKLFGKPISKEKFDLIDIGRAIVGVIFMTLYQIWYIYY
jgi:hypothetical protein